MPSLKKAVDKIESVIGVDLDGDGKVGGKPKKQPASGGGYPGQQQHNKHHNPAPHNQYQPPPPHQGGHHHSPGYPPAGGAAYPPPAQNPGYPAPPPGAAPFNPNPGYAQPNAPYPPPGAQSQTQAAYADPKTVKNIQDILPNKQRGEIEQVLVRNNNNQEAALNELLGGPAGSPSRASQQGGYGGGTAPHQSPYPQQQMGAPVPSAPPPGTHQPSGGPPPYPGCCPPNPQPWSRWCGQRHQPCPSPQLGKTYQVATNRPAPRPSGRKKALLIGINYYGTQAELRGCINDVNQMKGLLTRNGFQNGDSTMVALTDDQRDQRYLPTRANITNGILWLIAGAQPGDILFFHYSGHGAQQEDPHSAEDDGMDETILPMDFKKNGMITDTELFSQLVFPLPDGVRLISVMDCCHSGTGLDVPFNFDKSRSQWGIDTNPFHSAGDVVLFSASNDDQTAADASIEGRAGGAMTTAFCKAWEQGGGQRGYGEFIILVAQLIRQGGYPQKPNLGSSQPFDIRRPFTFDDIIGNMNPEIGCKFNRRIKHKKKLQFGGGLGNMVAAGALGYVAFSLLGDVAGGAMDEGGDVASGAISLLSGFL